MLEILELNGRFAFTLAGLTLLLGSCTPSTGQEPADLTLSAPASIAPDGSSVTVTVRATGANATLAVGTVRLGANAGVLSATSLTFDGDGRASTTFSCAGCSSTVTLTADWNELHVERSLRLATRPDAGVGDAGANDAGVGDAGADDGGADDAGEDGGTSDGGFAPDASMVDAGGPLPVEVSSELFLFASGSPTKCEPVLAPIDALDAAIIGLPCDARVVRIVDHKIAVLSAEGSNPPVLREVVADEPESGQFPANVSANDRVVPTTACDGLAQLTNFWADPFGGGYIYACGTGGIFQGLTPIAADLQGFSPVAFGQSHWLVEGGGDLHVLRPGVGTVRVPLADYHRGSARVLSSGFLLAADLDGGAACGLIEVKFDGGVSVRGKFQSLPDAGSDAGIDLNPHCDGAVTLLISEQSLYSLHGSDKGPVLLERQLRTDGGPTTGRILHVSPLFASDYAASPPSFSLNTEYLEPGDDGGVTHVRSVRLVSSP